jgi:branched-subunit amino acid transport protein
MRTLLVFVIGGAVTWLFRVAFIAVAPHGQVPPSLVRALRHAAPAAFAAIVGVSVSDTARSGALAGWPVVAATAVTLVVAMRTRHVLLTLVVGTVAATAFTAW